MTDQSWISGVMDEPQEELSVCPTFNSYSSDRLAGIAARVTDEFKNESEIAQQNLSGLPEANDVDDDFEFSLVSDGPEVFYDGRVQPVFPIFNRDLLVNNYGNKASTSDVVESGEIGIPLKDLFIQEREEEREPPSSSSSSSEADELESIPPGSYCVWRPKKVVESSPSCCKKSNSTGSASKRWKFLDLLRRSNSEGKDSYFFLTPKHQEKHENPKATQASGEVAKVASKSKAKGVAAPQPSSAHEALYVRNRAVKQGDKKKSYLPYRQDLVGFFANVNGLSRTFPPFKKNRSHLEFSN